MRLASVSVVALGGLLAVGAWACSGNALPADGGGAGDRGGQGGSGGQGGGGGGTGGGGPWMQHIGNACNLRVDAGANRATVNLQAPECESQICLQPMVDVDKTEPVDTGATCSAECATDADCANADARMSGAGDRRCQSRFMCGVATVTGSLCCKKLCLCADFVVIPKGGLQTPPDCDAANTVNRCQNLPGR